MLLRLNFKFWVTFLASFMRGTLWVGLFITVLSSALFLHPLPYFNFLCLCKRELFLSFFNLFPHFAPRTRLFLRYTKIGTSLSTANWSEMAGLLVFTLLLLLIYFCCFLTERYCVVMTKIIEKIVGCSF